jgi:hypothetical protein
LWYPVGIKDPPSQKQTHKRQKILTRQILDQKAESMYLFQLSRHASTKWPTMAPPYIPDAVVPAPIQDLSRSNVHNLLQLAKRLGGWARHKVWQVMEPYMNPEAARTL